MGNPSFLDLDEQNKSNSNTSKPVYMGNNNGSSYTYNEEPWTAAKVLSNINDWYQVDKKKANKMYKNFLYLQTQPTSKYYNPYAQATNRSVSALNAYGIDTSKIDDNFFQKNNYLLKYLNYNGTTNHPTKPGVKASNAEKAAYEYWQILSSEDDTRKAESQWQQLQDEISYWANDKYRNYSDDEILAKIDWSKYGELTSMDEKKALYQPNEYNRAIGYSQDALRGVIWNARNGGNNSLMDSMVGSYRGDGNSWQQNNDIAARLDATNLETYSPYSVGSTMEKEGLYFGVYNFDQKWIDENRARIMASGDETAMKYFGNVVDAVEYTDKLKQELNDMYNQIESLSLYTDDPDDIIEAIKNNTSAYKDLFDLDETLVKGPSSLKATASAVNYRWTDMEKAIREQCDTMSQLKDALGLKNEYAESADASDATKALYSIYKKNMNAMLPTIISNGTETEKNAAATGKYPDYEDMYKTLTDADVDTEKVREDAIRLAVTEYADISRIEHDYNTHKTQRDALVAQRDQFATELDSLRERNSIAASLAGMSDEEYNNLESIIRNPEMVPAWGTIENGEATGEKGAKYKAAINELYRTVTGMNGEDVPPEEKEEKVKLWLSYADSQSPIDKLIREANASGSDVDEIEDEIDGVQIRLERGDDGVFRFESAVADGQAYGADRKDEVNGILGYHTLSNEEYERMQILEANEKELNEKIQQEDDYLEVNQSIYDDMMMDKSFLTEAYAAAALVSEDIDPYLLSNIEYATRVANTFEPTQYDAYTVIDYALKKGEIDHEQAAQQGMASALLATEDARVLQDMLDNMESYGISFTDEEKNNLQRRIDQDRRNARVASYYELDGKEDFERVAAEALADKENLKTPVARLIAGLPGNYDTVPYASYAEYMTDDEKKRYLYLLKKDGEDAAQAYFNDLISDEGGVLPVRASEEKEKQLEAFASKNWATATLATLASFGTNVTGGPVALLYEAGQWLSGKEVNPYNSAFALQNSTQALRSGVQKAIGDSELGKLAYSAGTSFIDSFINSKITGKVLEVAGDMLSATRLGKVLNTISDAKRITEAGGEITDLGTAVSIGRALGENKTVAAKIGNAAIRIASDITHASTMGLNAASAAYADALKRGGTEDQAMAMFWVTFWAETGSEAITFDNLGSAFKAGSDEAKKGIVDFAKEWFKNGAEEFFGEGINEYAEQYLERDIMGALSEWDKRYNEYKDQGYSDTLARDMADQETWKDILRSGAAGFFSSSMGTGVRYFAGRYYNKKQKNNIEYGTIPDNYGGLASEDVLRNRYEKANPKDENVNVNPDDNQGHPPSGEAVVAEEIPVNTEAKAKKADVFAKDTTLLVSAYQSDTSTATTTIASVFNTGNADVDRAASQELIMGMSRGRPKQASRAMQGLLAASNLMENSDPAYLKRAITVASLTDGEGRSALQKAVNKAGNGRQITDADVNAIIEGVKNDRKADPKGFDNKFQSKLNDYMIADRTNQIAAENKDKIVAAQEEEKQNKEYLAEKEQQVSDAVEANNAAKEQAVAAKDTLKQDASGDGVQKVQNAWRHVERTDALEQQRRDEAEAQKKVVQRSEKKTNAIRDEVMDAARKQAVQEIGETQRVNAETSYNNAVENLQPLVPFGHSIRVYDSDGNPVNITGVYDRFDTGDTVSQGDDIGTGVDREGFNYGQQYTAEVYTTDDGRLVMNAYQLDRYGNPIRQQGDVDTSDFPEVADASDKLIGNNANGSDSIHPEIRPAVYFPASFPVKINGQDVQMIGLAGYENLEDETSPVIMGMDGNKYSLDDPMIENQIPSDTYGKAVMDAFFDNEDTLDEIPSEDITRLQEGNTNVGAQVQGAEETTTGDEGEGNNEGELLPASGRDDGSADNVNAGLDTGEGVHESAEDGVPGRVRPDKSRVSERLLSEKTRKKLGRKGVTSTSLHEETDPQRFSSILDAARENNKYKMFVDPQSPAELEEKGAIMLSSKDGLIMGAVGTNGIYNGDIFAVCKSPKSKAANASRSIIIHAIAQGGNKLDCYNGTPENAGLPRMYSSVGMIPVARVAFNDDFHQDDGWNYERDGRPDVIFWMLKPGETADSIVDKYGKTEEEGGFHLYTMEELANLPLFDDVKTVNEKGETVTEYGYDRAWAYRDGLLNGEGTIPNVVSSSTGVTGLVNDLRLTERMSDDTGDSNRIVLADSNGDTFGYVVENPDGSVRLNINPRSDTPETRKAVNDAGFEWDDSNAEWRFTPTTVNEGTENAEAFDMEGFLGEPSITPTNVASEQRAPTIVETPQAAPNQTTPITPTNPTTPTNPEGGKESQFAVDTAQNSPVFHDQVKQYLRDNAFYDVKHNMEEVDNAIGWVENHITQKDTDGFYGAFAEAVSEDFNPHSIEGQARLLVLTAMARANNLVAEQTRLAEVIKRSGTDEAQAMQFRRLYRLLLPEAREEILRREMDSIEEEYRSRGKKDLKLNLSQETLDMAKNAKSEAEFDNARKKMHKELAEQIPSDWRLKMRTFRMASMLLNPRTHIRNLEGNWVFKAPLAIKNKIGAVLETAVGVEKGERTKALKRTKESIEFATEDANSQKNVLQGSGKYGFGNVEMNRKAFGTKDNWFSKTFGKALQKTADWNSSKLEAEDWIFLKKHYINALSSYMSANGYTKADMKGATLAKGRQYATREAQKATYRDFNQLAKWLSDQSNKPEAVQFGINAVIPFVKTPMNIVRRGIEYSPAGLAYSLATKKNSLEAYKQWEENGFKGKKPKNAKSPGEVFDSIASGMTGTMLAGIGYALSKLGLLKVKPSEAEKKEGSQDYSIEFLGLSFGIGNMPPTALPLLLGGSINEEITKLKKGEADLGNILQAISNMLQPTMETTMLMGINNLIESNKYNTSGDTLSPLVQKVLANYASSFMPSALGAIAKTVDPTKRKAYVKSGDSMATWTALLEQTENKIPFLSMNNVPYLNTWGEEQTNNPFMAFLENVILPDNINKLSDSELDQKLEEISEKTGIDVRPNATNEKYTTINNEKIIFDDKQWYQYSSSRGQESKRVLQELIERPEFVALDAEVQAELVKKVYKYAKAKAAVEMFPQKEVTDNWTKGALKANNVIDYIFEKEEESAKKASNDAHRKALYNSIQSNDLDAAKVDIDMLRMGGVKDTSIKSSITNTYKPLYKEAYESGDYDEMNRISTMLRLLGLGYEKYDFSKWLK